MALYAALDASGSPDSRRSINQDLVNPSGAPVAEATAVAAANLYPTIDKSPLVDNSGLAASSSLTSIASEEPSKTALSRPAAKEYGSIGSDSPPLSRVSSETDAVGGTGGLLADKSQTAVWVGRVREYSIAACVGILFGFALERGKVDEYYFIREQMAMYKTFVMLKMFLSAATVSVSSITLMSYFGSEKVKQNARVTGDWMGVYHRGFPALVLGCFLLGVGMTVSGSCPGTVFAQIGAGSYKAWYSIAGGVVGALLYGALDANRWFQRFHEVGRIDPKFNFLYGPHFLPRWLTTLILASVFIGAIATAEVLVPWETDLEKLYPGGLGWNAAIHPVLAGAIIGSLQWILVGVLQQHLGCSGSYCTLVANTLFFYKASPHFNALRTRIWQVWLVIGAALGAMISTQSSGVHFASDEMLEWWEALLGGFLFLFGSRMAAGCTSGHGISGMGHLALTSFVGVGAMFAGAIGAYYAFYYTTA